MTPPNWVDGMVDTLASGRGFADLNEIFCFSVNEAHTQLLDEFALRSARRADDVGHA